ncbi:PepSY-associated TM helix domain-containing protein [Mycolicibacterium thermoresistibile]
MTTTPDDHVDADTGARTTAPTQRRAMSTLLRRLHFYAGVFVGPFILIAAVTGLLYALIPQIDAAVHRHELTVDRVGDRPLPLADQLAAARAAHPEGAVSSIRPPVTAEETTQVTLAVDPGTDGVPADYARTVFVDPYTGAVRGALTTYGQWMPVRAWFDELHRNLHLGAVGRHYSELAASWLWVIALVGLVLWVRHRRQTGKLRRLALPDGTGSSRNRALSRHGAVGVWILIALLGLSVTGITWSRYGGASVDRLQQQLNSTAPVVDTSLVTASAIDPHAGHHASAGTGDELLHGADTALRSAQQAGLSGPMWMYPPTEPGAAWQVAEKKRDWPTRNDAVAVDPASGAITDRVDFSEWPVLAKLTRWAIDAHMGILFGVVNQVVLALTAVGLIYLIVRGYRMWWQRRPVRGSSWALGRPPLRGALRALGPLPAAALLVAAVLVGWFLPLFGLSLLAFVLVDAAVGRWKRRRAVNAPPVQPD